MYAGQLLSRVRVVVSGREILPRVATKLPPDAVGGYTIAPGDDAPAGHREAARLEVGDRKLNPRGRAMFEQAASPCPEAAQVPRHEQRLVEVSTTSLGASGTDSSAMRTLAIALFPYLRKLLLSAQRRDEHLLDVCAAVPGPRRTIMAACRRGDISGAVRIGRRWLAPRAGIDAWLRARGPRIVPSPDGDQDDLESVRRSLATPGRRRRRV
jgi:hypothetical protein